MRLHPVFSAAAIVGTIHAIGSAYTDKQLRQASMLIKDDGISFMLNSLRPNQLSQRNDSDESISLYDFGSEQKGYIERTDYVLLQGADGIKMYATTAAPVLVPTESQEFQEKKNIACNIARNMKETLMPVEYLLYRQKIQSVKIAGTDFLAQHCPSF